jgi:hypothetical protein
MKVERKLPVPRPPDIVITLTSEEAQLLARILRQNGFYGNADDFKVRLYDAITEAM